MLTNSVCHDFAILRHGIHFYLFGMFDKLTYYHRMFLRYIGCQFQETLQFFLIGTNIHRSSRKHIRRANEYGEPYFFDKLMDIFHRGQLTPTGLIHPDTIEHGREFLTVFSIVDTLSTCTENINLLCVQTQSKVIRNLSASRHNYPMRILKL